MEREQLSPLDLVISIPTFDRRKSLLEEAGISEKESPADAFLFYSNDEARMRRLCGGIVGAGESSTSTADVTRKTRISFELHPSVLFEDLLVSNYSSVGDIESKREDFIKSVGEKPHLKFLAISLFGGDPHAKISSPRAA